MCRVIDGAHHTGDRDQKQAKSKVHFRRRAISLTYYERRHYSYLNAIRVGPDNTFGTGDDVDVDFGLDDYVPDEGLVGIEDTLNVIAFGLSSMPTDLTSASH